MQGATLSIRFREVFESICLIESQLKEVTKAREPVLVFVLSRYLPYRELSTKKSKERQGATRSVRFSEVCVL